MSTAQGAENAAPAAVYDQPLADAGGRVVLVRNEDFCRDARIRDPWVIDSWARVWQSKSGGAVP